MTDLEMMWTLSTPALLGLLAAAVALLLLLIIKMRVHAFLTLIIVSLLTAIAAGVPADKLVPVLLSGFGSTLGSVALLVGLGAMLGRMLEMSGGAQVLTDALIRLFGEKRAPLALAVASLMFGFPIFFDAGLVVMLPIIFAVARRLGGSLLLYAFPSAVAFSVMHIFVPPHPGPVTASGLLEANLGLVLILGLVVAIPTWYFAGLLFGRFLGKRIDIPVPSILSGGPQSDDSFVSKPRLGTIMFLLLLPLVLIFLNTGLNMLATAKIVSTDDTWVQILRALGETPIALLITVVLAMLLLGRAQGKSGTLIEKVVDGALGPIASIVLITGAGGMFGGVLRSTGIGEALADVLSGIGLPVFIAGFLIAALVRIAQGSATVALTTAAALVQPLVVGSAGGFNEIQVAAIVLALAAGSVVAGHVNDSGFWLVSRFFGMDTATTLKTWTVGQTLIGVIGVLIAGGIYLLASIA